MSAGIEDLYRGAVQRHRMRTDYRQELKTFDAESSVENRTCGDTASVRLSFNHGDCIEQISVTTEGCSICHASGVMMGDAVKGHARVIARGKFDELTHLLSADDNCSVTSAQLSPDLLLLRVLNRYPNRRRCALLPWEAFAAALQTVEEEVKS